MEQLRNPVNPVTNGAQKSGRINGVAVVNGFFKLENDWLSFCSGQNKVAVITRWLYQRGGHKEGLTAF